MYFIFYQDCIFSTGYSFSLIIDTHDKKYLRIENAIFNKYINTSQRSYKLSTLNNDFFKKLIDTNYGYIDDKENEIIKSTEFEEPKIITNVVLDINDSIDFDYKVNQIILLNPETLLLRFDLINNSLFERFDKLIKNSGIRCIDIKLNFNNTINILKFVKQILSNQRYRLIEIYNFENRNNYKTNFNSKKVFIFKNDILKLSNHCNLINLSTFNFTRSFIFESMCNNNCLHKKMAINSDGLIKNCPFHNKSFGNIKNENLKLVAESKEFQSQWKTTKYQIDVCKDCEYKLICTDCRVYTLDSKQTSKPVYCSYDPYNGVWDKNDLINSK